MSVPNKYLDNLSIRLKSMGGYSQIDRMNRDKLNTLKKALKYSYQARTISYTDPTTGEVLSTQCLLNKKKLSMDQDLKVISAPFKADLILREGQVLSVKQSLENPYYPSNDLTYWIICSQYLEETAYFRAEVRRCRHSIIINGHTYHFYFRGPVENSLVYARNNTDFINKLNETGIMYITQNKETSDFFKRFQKVKFVYNTAEAAENKVTTYWEVEQVDKLSNPNLIEISLKEDFSNSITGDPTDNNVVEAIVETKKTSIEDAIQGPTQVYPFDVYTYTLSDDYKDDGIWSIDTNKAKITNQNGKTVKINITSGKSGNFILTYTNSEGTIDLPIEILSL